MKNGMPNQPPPAGVMNRPPGMMGPGSTGSVPSPIQPHHPQMPPAQHGMPQRAAMMGSMGPQQMSGPGGMPPGMMMMQQQHQQQMQPSPMMGQHPQMAMPSQQQPMVGMAPQPPPPTMQPPPISKQSLCRVGADTVQEIVSKTLELFQLLRSMALTFSNANQEDKKIKIKETCKLIENLFKRLRKIYEACNEACSSIDYVDPKSLLHLRDDDEADEDDKDKLKDSLSDGRAENNISGASSIPIIIPEEKKNNPKLQQLEKEYHDLVELNKLKNRQLKEIIDRIRKLVWDINTMLAMRRP